ncbi:unnamed protein product [Merluccius merluccius]
MEEGEEKGGGDGEEKVKEKQKHLVTWSRSWSVRAAGPYLRRVSVCGSAGRSASQLGAGNCGTGELASSSSSSTPRDVTRRDGSTEHKRPISGHGGRAVMVPRMALDQPGPMNLDQRDWTNEPGPTSLD